MQLFCLDKKFPRPETTLQNLGLFWFIPKWEHLYPWVGHVGQPEHFFWLGGNSKEHRLETCAVWTGKVFGKVWGPRKILQKWLICVEENQSRMIWMSFIRSMYRNILQIPGTRGNCERPIDRIGWYEDMRHGKHLTKLFFFQTQLQIPAGHLWHDYFMLL